MQNLSEETLARLRAHLTDFYESVRFSLAIFKKAQGWRPLYFLAEYDYQRPEQFLKLLFDTPQFRIASGRIDVAKWESYLKEIGNGGKVSASMDNDETVAVTFSPWKDSRPLLVTGLEARHDWHRAWPAVQINYSGGLNASDAEIWQLMRNVAITYRVPYATISEAVSHKLDISEDKLEFKTAQATHGTILLPIFASVEHVGYGREGPSVDCIARVVYHSKVDPDKLLVSARVTRRDQSVERLQQTPLSSYKVAGPEEGLLRREWRQTIQTPATSVHLTSFHLAYEGLDTRFPIDEDYLRFVPVIVPKTEIERLMTEGTGRRRLDNLTKIENLLLDGKGDKFEEGMEMLLCRMGFDVAWEGKQSRFDTLAVSPNGSLIVECTSDPPSAAQAEDLKERANSYRNESNPLVLPVLATNMTQLSEVEADLGLIGLERQGEIYFLTRDRLKRLFEEVKHESLGRTEKYLNRFQR